MTTGVRASMARALYSEQWRVRSANPELVIFCATLVRNNFSTRSTLMHIQILCALKGCDINDMELERHYWRWLYVMRSWIGSQSLTVVDYTTFLKKQLGFQRENQEERVENEEDDNFINTIPQ
jgi:hypothetical protein